MRFLDFLKAILFSCSILFMAVAFAKPDLNQIVYADAKLIGIPEQFSAKFVVSDNTVLNKLDISYEERLKLQQQLDHAKDDVVFSYTMKYLKQEFNEDELRYISELSPLANDMQIIDRLNKVESKVVAHSREIGEKYGIKQYSIIEQYLIDHNGK